MSGFKEMTERDMKQVFLNTLEFAELRRITYGEKVFNIPVVIDNLMQKDRPISSADHAEGIFAVTTTLYAAQSDLQLIPKKKQPIWIDDDEYYVVTSACDQGHIVLELRRYEE